MNSQFPNPQDYVPSFNTQAVQTEVVNPSPNPAPQAKGRSPQSPKPQKAIPPKFEIAHAKLIGMMVGSLSLGLAIAQGVLAKVQIETGIPTWDIYWLAMGPLVLAGILFSSKTGNQGAFTWFIQLAIAAVLAPSLVTILNAVFGG